MKKSKPKHDALPRKTRREAEPSVATAPSSVAPVRDSGPGVDDTPRTTLRLHRNPAGAITIALQGLDPYLFVILVIPFLVLLRDSNIAFTPVGYLDPWIYFSYFHNLIPFEHDVFPGTYYGSRLSWLLPGYVIYKIFAPLAAHYVLRFGLFYLAAVSLFFTLKHAIDRRTALLTVIALGFYPYFWSAIGTDYVDGVGIAYYLLTTAILTRAAELDDERLSLVLAGASFAALFYTNVAWLMYAPFFPIYYFWRRIVTRKIYWPLMLVRFVMYFAAGCFLVTAVLCGINYLIAGYPWFYLVSLLYGGGSILKPSPWKAPDLSWVKNAKWLLLPGMTVLICVVAALSARIRLLSRRHTSATVFLLNFLGLATLLAYLEIRVTPLMQFPYYASYLIPPIFLVLGSWTFRVPERLTRKWFGWLVLCVILLFAIPWWDVGGRIPRMLGKLPPAGLLFLVCGGLLAATVLAGRQTVLLVSLVGFSLFNAYLGTVSHAPANAGRDAYIRITRGLENIENIRTPGRGVRFWFDVYEPYGREFDSLASTYLWGYSLIGREFPALQPDLEVPASTLIILPSSRGDLSGAAQKAFLRKDLTLRPKTVIPIHYGSGGYTLAFLEVVATPGNVRPLQAVFDRNTAMWRWTEPKQGDADSPLPADRWTTDARPNTGSSLEHLPTGVRVIATTGSSKYAVLYGPLQAPVDGGYLFRLRVRPSFGSPRFGVLDGEKKQWLVPAPLTHAEGAYQYQECSLHLRAGQPFWLAAAAAPADFVIEEMRAYRFRE
jgi:hypothetical protein